MTPEPQDPLALEIDRALKSLPELRAPATLAPRVMAAIRRRTRAPWFCQPWTAWPVPLQILSLFLLLGLFFGLCYAGWKLPQMPAYAVVANRLTDACDVLGSFWSLLGLLLNALLLSVKQLGAGVCLAGLLSLALGYALCVGLGTLYLRLALARR